MSCEPEIHSINRIGKDTYTLRFLDGRKYTIDKEDKEMDKIIEGLKERYAHELCSEDMQKMWRSLDRN